jgi:hyperosmotically inducible periplasmic protein
MKVLHQGIPGSKAMCAAASVALALTLVACERQSEPTAKPAPAPALPAEPPPQVVVPEKPTLPPEVTADKELAGKVKSALVAERGLNGHGIDVVAKNGVITLYGTAETAGRRDTAARVAGSIAGVRSVENKLAVVAGS